MVDCSLSDLRIVDTIDGPTPAVVAALDETDQGSRLWGNAFLVVLRQESRGHWIGSTLELQLVSFDICDACRGVRTFHVTVDKRMPLSLWGDDDSIGNDDDETQRRRLPAVRATAVEWRVPAGMLVPKLSQAVLIREAEWLQLIDIGYTYFGTRERSPLPLARLVHSPSSYFEETQAFLDSQGLTRIALRRLGNVSWPPALRQLSLGCKWYGNIDSLALPSTLERLALGGDFNQSIESVAWPVSLTHLSLGNSFKQPIADAAWPACLLKLMFGYSFDQPIINVVWPASLQQLVFGHCFNQPVNHDVVWPASLLRLAFGVRFDQPIDNVVWPATLQQLAFGFMFNQPISEVVWPNSLTQLVFGRGFWQMFYGVVWPSGLQSVVLGQPINQQAMGLVWPASLRQLTFTDESGYPIPAAVWRPPSENLTSAGNDGCDNSVDQVDWPPREDLFDRPRGTTIVVYHTRNGGRGAVRSGES